MTLQQIRDMFPVGSRWHIENSYLPKMNGERTLIKLATKFNWLMNDGRKPFAPFPKQSQVIEASDGKLVYRLFTPKSATLPGITGCQITR